VRAEVHRLAVTVVESPGNLVQRVPRLTRRHYISHEDIVRETVRIWPAPIRMPIRILTHAPRGMRHGRTVRLTGYVLRQGIMMDEPSGCNQPILSTAIPSDEVGYCPGADHAPRQGTQPGAALGLTSGWAQLPRLARSDPVARGACLLGSLARSLGTKAKRAASAVAWSLGTVQWMTPDNAAPDSRPIDGNLEQS
jgi:hypothetical protein